MYYAFPDRDHPDDRSRAIAFCKANGINPKAPLYGSTFELTDDGVLILREFVLVDGTARLYHEACCGAGHFAKRQGRYALQAKPEDFGFVALRDATGEVAP